NGPLASDRTDLWEDGGIVELRDSLVIRNIARWNGGGIFNYSASAPPAGGGTVLISGSALIGNWAAICSSAIQNNGVLQISSSSVDAADGSENSSRCYNMHDWGTMDNCHGYSIEQREATEDGSRPAGEYLVTIEYGCEVNDVSAVSSLDDDHI